MNQQKTAKKVLLTPLLQQTGETRRSQVAVNTFALPQAKI
jgi:hypothetical protein